MLVIQGRTGTYPFAWACYALLRDNVQHYVEHGKPCGRFPTLHSIALAVDEGTCAADPQALREEVVRAVSSLRSVPLTDAAMSSRTRAIQIGSPEVPRVGHTGEARLLGWELPVAGLPTDSVPYAAEGFVDAVLCATSAAAAWDQLQIRRLTERQR